MWVSCNTKAIAFCGFGTTRSYQVWTASIRRSPRNCAASPPPEPSPFKGEGLTIRSHTEDFGLEVTRAKATGADQ
jgi:hypothetical protein